MKENLDLDGLKDLDDHTRLVIEGLAHMVKLGKSEEFAAYCYIFFCAAAHHQNMEARKEKKP